MSIHVSPRNKIKFRGQPIMGRGVGLEAPRWGDAYPSMVDTLYEHADAVKTGNGVSAESAVASVAQNLKDEEGWKFFPNHLKLVINKLKEPE